MTIDQIKAIFKNYEGDLPPEIKLLFEALITIVDQQQIRIKELEDQIAKNSRNSSKPPSSDGLNHKKTESLRPKSNRKTGGQPGHKGHKLELRSDPDQVILHRLESCPNCDTDLSKQEVEEIARKQIWDIPPIKLHVIEHQQEIKTCSCCGITWQAGGLPEHIKNEVEYGPGIKALGVYLQHHQHLPMKRGCELMQELFSIPISQASLSNFSQNANRRLTDFESLVHQCILDSEAGHFDETGIRLFKKNYWLHTSSTLNHVLYVVHPKRGGAALQDIGILPNYQGVAHHDAYSPYLALTKLNRSLCNAHVLRELTFALEQKQQSWAGEMISLLCRIKKKVDQSPHACLDTRWQGRYRKQFQKIINEGLELNPPPKEKSGKRGRTKKTKMRNLLERLNKYQDEYLKFMSDPNAQFDNNLAERDLRMIKVKMKISGCFRSWEGSQASARIRSFIMTAQKQSVNIMMALKDVFSPKPNVYLQLTSG